MPLDWLNTPLDADIGDLIARKKRSKTIELLRSQLQGRMVPPVQLRLQLADLLVQAGREGEAVPVLIGLADEFAGDGFVAKAIAILKRVDKVQPGREDVESRLARLVKLQHAAPVSKSRRRQVPEFGIEEIRDDPPADVTAPDAGPPEAAASPEPAAVPATGATPEVVRPLGAPAVAPTPPPADTETIRRVRGVFRRFLASLPGGSSSAEASPPPVMLPVAEAFVTAPAGTVFSASAPTDETVPDAAVVEAGKETVPDAAVFEPDEDTAPHSETIDSDSETIDASYAIVPDAEPTEPAVAAAPEEATGEAKEPEAKDDDDPVTARYAPVPPEAWSTAAPPAVEAAPPAAGSAAEAHGVAGRIRGAFRWLVASLATPAGEMAGTASPPGAAAPDPAPIATSASTPPELAAAPGETPAAVPDTTTAAGPAAVEAGADGEPLSDEVFQERLLDLVEDILHRPGARKAPLATAPLDRLLVLRYAQRLLATALFGDLSEEELLAVVRGLRLHLHGPGDVLVTEGERGQSVFVLAAGGAKVFVRSPSGRNFPVAELREGDFFGEISSLSGRPRSATVTASTRCELLELDRPTLDSIAGTHPRVADVLEEFYIRRASSPEAAAVRAVSLNEAGAEKKAIEALEAHFGQSRWDPRMRLRLADVLLKAGKYQDAVPVLIGLADELARSGYPEKAIAVLKKIEKIQRRDIEEVNLAPRRGAAPTERRRKGPRPAPDAAPAAVAAAVRPGWGPQPTAEFFQGWLVDVLRDRVKRAERAEGHNTEADRSALGGVRGYGPGLMASPLFEDFTDDELLAVIRGLRLLAFEAGDVIITEGEPGQSLFVLTTGTVKVFVRDPAGRNVALCPLGEGAFFGEIATLSGRPRSATVTAAARCELLELDQPALDAILKAHPRVRDVLEEHYIARATDPEAAAIRGTRRDEPTPDGS